MKQRQRHRHAGQHRVPTAYNSVTLTFVSPKQERQYRAYFSRQYLWQLQLSLDLCAAMYASFGYFDPDDPLALAVRGVVVAVILLVRVTIGRSRTYVQLQALAALVALAAALGIIGIGMLPPLAGHPEADYLGIMLVLMLSGALSRLRWIIVALVGAVVIGCYEAAAAARLVAAPSEPPRWDVVFLLCTYCIALYSSRFIEINSRMEFVRHPTAFAAVTPRWLPLVHNLLIGVLSGIIVYIITLVRWRDIVRQVLG